MKKKDLITVTASCLMLLAYFAMPAISGVNVRGFVIEQTTDLSLSMYKMIGEEDAILCFLILLLLLLAPIYLLVDVFREKIQEKLSWIKKVVISEKVAMSLPIVLIVIMTLSIKQWLPDLGKMAGVDFSIVYGWGYYLYLVASIVLVVLPWIKHPLLDSKEENRPSEINPE